MWPDRWRRRILFTGVACVCSVVVPAIVRAQQPPEPPVQHSTPAVAPIPDDQPEFASPTTSDRVGRVVAAVQINGQGPFRFILDTGANRSAMSQRTLETLGLTPTRQSLVHGITGSAVMPLVLVDELRAGELRFKDRGIAVLPAAVFAGVDGILGIDCLQHARIDIDFDDDRVMIGRSGKPAERDRYLIRAKVRHRGLLLIPARVGNVSVQAIVDTGAERSLGNEALRAALTANRRRELEGETTNVVGATAQVAEGFSFAAPDIDFGGGAHVGNLTVTFGDFHVFKVWSLMEEPALVVGMDVLGTLPALTIDYPRRQFQLKITRTTSTKAR